MSYCHVVKVTEITVFIVLNTEFMHGCLIVVTDSTDPLETKISGIYASNRTLSIASSPYVATSDVTVSKGVTLTIEAGVQINFQARVRLHVKGTLVAQGSPGNEIVMFHNATMGVDSTSIRLAEGNSPREGRVEVYNGHSWGTVCDDNWDRSDAIVVCEHLGFGHPVEASTHKFGKGIGIIGLSNVNCRGTENSLFDCSGANKWNNNNCQHSQDVGVVCGTVGVGYWGGILFYPDGATERVLYYYYRKYSSNSSLQNVKIVNAGVITSNVGTYQTDIQVAAITMTTASPLISNVSIINSSHSGILMNALHSDVHFSGLVIDRSSSSGISGSCSWQFQCDGCQLSDNGVSGIDVNSILPLLKQPTSAIPTHTASSSSFTSYSIDDRGAYLVLSSAQIRSDYTSSITTGSGYGLTITIQHLSLYGGRLDIVDGVTGQTVRSFYSSSTPNTVTIPYHEAAFFFDYYSWYSSSNIDVKAFISRYPIGKIHSYFATVLIPII